MKVSDVIALAAAVIALASVALHLWLRSEDKKEARHTSVMTALQGEKEAVGYEAFRIGVQGWPRHPDEREQVRDALCLAFIFERSGRTRAMIYRALKTYPPAERADLDSTLTNLLAIFKDAQNEAQSLDADWDLHRGWERLAMLGKMLNIPHITETATQRLNKPPAA